MAFALALCSTAAAQVAILQIRIIEGEGRCTLRGRAPRARSRWKSPTKPASQWKARPVSFHLPEEGPGGLFANNIQTDVSVTDSHGHASVRGLQFNRSSGRFMILIVASKEQARAASRHSQYIAEPSGGAGSGGRPATAGSSHRYRKWIAVALLAGGGRGGGDSGGRKVGDHTGRGGGFHHHPGYRAPTITVGKPWSARFLRVALLAASLAPRVMASFNCSW